MPFSLSKCHFPTALFEYKFVLFGSLFLLFLFWAERHIHIRPIGNRSPRRNTRLNCTICEKLPAEILGSQEASWRMKRTTTTHSWWHIQLFRFATNYLILATRVSWGRHRAAREKIRSCTTWTTWVFRKQRKYRKMPTQGLHVAVEKSPICIAHMRKPAEGSVDHKDYQNVSETTSEPCFDSKVKI